MDSYKIIITPDAETDLFEIRDYIAYTLLVPDVALNYIRAIRSEIQKLTYMASNIAPIEREPWHSRGVRKITAKNFYIYYRTDDSSGRVYILKNGLDTECKKMLYELAEEYRFQILAMEVMPDHIHLLLDCKPQFFISDMIKIMKGNLARQLFLSHPELKRELWGGHLWNPSYCAVTVSDRSRDQVMAYIEGQKEREKRK